MTAPGSVVLMQVELVLVEVPKKTSVPLQKQVPKKKRFGPQSAISEDPKWTPEIQKR